MLQILNRQLLTDIECDSLVAHFTKMIFVVNNSENVNPEYNGRLLNAFECESHVKDFLYRKSMDLGSIISKVYGVESIYPETIHLVKWETGNSLGVHADNTWIGSNDPHYSPNRNFSATFTLNEGFEGGQFYFQDGENQHLYPSRLGWGNVFGAGPEYAHGVTEVTSGTRYTLAIWYTSDYQHSLYKTIT